MPRAEEAPGPRLPWGDGAMPREGPLMVWSSIPDAPGTAPHVSRSPDLPTPSPVEQAVGLASHLAEELTRAWRLGERPCAEDFLRRAPGLAEHPHAAALVVHEEVRLRRELGPPIDAEELRRRFPQWEAALLPLLRRLEPQDAGPVFPDCGETFAECRLLAELGRGAQ